MRVIPVGFPFRHHHHHQPAAEDENEVEEDRAGEYPPEAEVAVLWKSRESRVYHRVSMSVILSSDLWSCDFQQQQTDLALASRR
jgi:hypothetical protein